jgi:hypothetical protein
MAKKLEKANPMGDYVPTKKENEAFDWCINNGVRIYPSAYSSDYNNKLWYLNVEINKQIRKSPKTYGPVEIWKKLHELYKFYYDKNNIQNSK